jgi:quercetin dioxygenase-like cupin family protein
MKPLPLLYLLCLLGFASPKGYAQTNLYSLAAADTFDNVYVQPLYADTLVSSFVIWVKADVPAHLHKGHTEHIVVLEGMAEVLLGDTTQVVVPGDLLIVPRGTRHAVRVLSPTPLKVLSVQAPKFRDGVHRTPASLPDGTFIY